MSTRRSTSLSRPVIALHEVERLADRRDDLLVLRRVRRALRERHVPVLGVVQVREPAVGQRADEVERERGALVGAQHQLGIGRAIGGGERVAVDEVAAIRRQRDAAARLDVGRARLRVLAGDAADADRPACACRARARGHLEQDLELRGDRRRSGSRRSSRRSRRPAARTRRRASRARGRARSASTSHEVTSGRQLADLVQRRARARRGRRTRPAAAPGARCQLSGDHAAVDSSGSVPLVLAAERALAGVVEADGAPGSRPDRSSRAACPCAARSAATIASRIIDVGQMDRGRSGRCSRRERLVAAGGEEVARDELVGLRVVGAAAVTVIASVERARRCRSSPSRRARPTT